MKLWTWAWKSLLPTSVYVDGWALFAGGCGTVEDYRKHLCRSEEEAIKQLASYTVEGVIIYLGDVEFEPIDKGE